MSIEHIIKSEPVDEQFIEDYYSLKGLVDEGFSILANDKEGNFLSEKYEDLCRHYPKLPENEEKKLKYFYWTNNQHPSLVMSPVKLEILYSSPQIVRFYDVVTDVEIDHLIQVAKPKLFRSGVGGSPSLNRTSQNAFVEDDEVADRITNRIEHITGLNMVAAEPLQVSNYGLGGHYVEHSDVLPPKNLTNGNRLATFLIYLTDVNFGGNTVFVHPEISIAAVKGSAVFWFNVDQRGKLDWRTVHGGCPVVIGDKWIATKWIRERGQEFIKKCRDDISLEYNLF